MNVTCVRLWPGESNAIQHSVSVFKMSQVVDRCGEGARYSLLVWLICLEKQAEDRSDHKVLHLRHGCLDAFIEPSMACETPD